MSVDGPAVDRAARREPADGGGPESADLLDAFAAGLRRRVRQRLLTEERLGAFAFREGTAGARDGGRHSAAPGGGRDPGAGHGADGGSVTDWRFFTAQALRAAVDPDALRVLELVRDAPLPLSGLGPALGSHDPAAIADRVADLTAAGLASRDLESGVVSLTALGAAALDLVDELASRAAQRDAP